MYHGLTIDSKWVATKLAVNLRLQFSAPQCPDIVNYDTNLGEQENDSVFGDIDDPDAECGYGSCTYHLGEINIGTTDSIVGPTPEICEF